MSFQVGRGCLPLIITRQRLSDTRRHLSVQLGPSLAIHEKALGPNHTDVGASLHDLAGLYLSQGRYTEAEPQPTNPAQSTFKMSGCSGIILLTRFVLFRAVLPVAQRRCSSGLSFSSARSAELQGAFARHASAPAKSGERR